MTLEERVHSIIAEIEAAGGTTDLEEFVKALPVENHLNCIWWSEEIGNIFFPEGTISVVVDGVVDVIGLINGEEIFHYEECVDTDDVLREVIHSDAELNDWENGKDGKELYFSNNNWISYRFQYKNPDGGDDIYDTYNDVVAGCDNVLEAFEGAEDLRKMLIENARNYWKAEKRFAESVGLNLDKATKGDYLRFCDKFPETAEPILDYDIFSVDYIADDDRYFLVDKTLPDDDEDAFFEVELVATLTYNWGEDPNEKWLHGLIDSTCEGEKFYIRPDNKIEHLWFRRVNKQKEV